MAYVVVMDSAYNVHLSSRNTALAMWGRKGCETRVQLRYWYDIAVGSGMGHMKPSSFLTYNSQPSYNMMPRNTSMISTPPFQSYSQSILRRVASHTPQSTLASHLNPHTRIRSPNACTCTSPSPSSRLPYVTTHPPVFPYLSPSTPRPRPL